jgi:hypothetical protein
VWLAALAVAMAACGGGGGNKPDGYQFRDQPPDPDDPCYYDANMKRYSGFGVKFSYPAEDVEVEDSGTNFVILKKDPTSKEGGWVFAVTLHENLKPEDVEKAADEDFAARGEVAQKSVDANVYELASGEIGCSDIRFKDDRSDAELHRVCWIPHKKDVYEVRFIAIKGDDGIFDFEDMIDTIVFN